MSPGLTWSPESWAALLLVDSGWWHLAVSLAPSFEHLPACAPAPAPHGALPSWRQQLPGDPASQPLWSHTPPWQPPHPPWPHSEGNSALLWITHQLKGMMQLVGLLSICSISAVRVFHFLITRVFSGAALFISFKNFHSLLQLG